MLLLMHQKINVLMLELQIVQHMLQVQPQLHQNVQHVLLVMLLHLMDQFVFLQLLIVQHMIVMVNVQHVLLVKLLHLMEQFV